MHSTLSLSSFPNVSFVALTKVSVKLTMAVFHTFKLDCKALPSTTSFLQATDGVMSLALCLQAMPLSSSTLQIF